MSGLIGKKLGMTSIFDTSGRSIGCTVIEAGPCFVTQIKESKTDGYKSIQLAYDEKKSRKTSKALKGHFDVSKVTPKKKIIEFRNFKDEFSDKVKLGMEINIEDIFNENEFLDVSAISKGKGFQGVVKRHGFAGVNDATHGQHNRQRHPGSIGAASYPARVFKGMRMGGQMGNARVKVENLEVIKVIQDKNIVVLKGAIPGANNSYVIIEK